MFSRDLGGIILFTVNVFEHILVLSCQKTCPKFVGLEAQKFER